MDTSASSRQVTVVGADVHKRTHTFVARAEVGRKLAEKVVSATQAYYRKRIASGAFTTEALRCLKRRLARVVFHHLHTDHHNRIQPCQPAAA